MSKELQLDPNDLESKRGGSVAYNEKFELKKGDC